ncbi:MAG: aldo/keto reductase [Puniceicoccaceae bacterium]
MESHSSDHSKSPFFTKEIKGTPVPALGFGTFELKGAICRNAVAEAIETGYRHLDTARAYGNEVEVGEAVRDTGFPRGQLFITTKVWREDLSPHGIRSAVEGSLNALRTDYLDLVLIHWPNPATSLEESIETFRIFQEAGKILHYGVSNFPSALFEEACVYGDIFCNQVEYHPLLKQDKVLAGVRRRKAALTAYSPLAQGEAIGYPELEAIGERHGKSSEQVALRWLIEQDNVLVIPRSSNPDHIQNNFDIFDFGLDAEDKDRIAKLPKDKRQINPSFAPEWDEE